MSKKEYIEFIAMFLEKLNEDSLKDIYVLVQHYWLKQD